LNSIYFLRLHDIVIVPFLKTSGWHSINGKKKGGTKKDTVIDDQSLMISFIEFNAAIDNDQYHLWQKNFLKDKAFLFYKLAAGAEYIICI